MPNPQVLKCGCVFDGKEFTKYCREHGLMILRKRWEKLTDKKFPIEEPHA